MVSGKSLDISSADGVPTRWVLLCWLTYAFLSREHGFLSIVQKGRNQSLLTRSKAGQSGAAVRETGHLAEVLILEDQG